MSTQFSAIFCCTHVLGQISSVWTARLGGPFVLLSWILEGMSCVRVSPVCCGFRRGRASGDDDAQGGWGLAAAKAYDYLLCVYVCMHVDMHQVVMGRV
jgi:hypothetical protein